VEFQKIPKSNKYHGREDFFLETEMKFLIDDLEFSINRIVILPKIRPHQHEKTLRLSAEYCKLADFRRKLL